MDVTTSRSQFISSFVIPPPLIMLDVSGWKIRTEKATLQAFPYFQNLLARWNDCSNRLEDGSYYIDADPKIFQHILQFMRRPSRFPLFWTKDTRFDYVLYNKVETEASHFRLYDLRDWIRNKRYLDAVKTVTEVRELSEHELDDPRNQIRCDSDVEVHIFLGPYSGEEWMCDVCALHEDIGAVYVCETCGDLTRGSGAEDDDLPKRLTIVTKRTEFDETVCVNTRYTEGGERIHGD
jgi:hypothetical protein